MRVKLVKRLVCAFIFHSWMDLISKTIQELSLCPVQDLCLYRSSRGLVSWVQLLSLLHFLTALGQYALQPCDLVLHLQHLCKSNNPFSQISSGTKPLRSSITCFICRDVAFRGVKRRFRALLSDSRPHKGAFEGVSGQIKPGKKKTS